MEFDVYIIMQKLSSILLFYKPYFIWSCAMNILITIFNPEITIVIGTKLFLTIFLWHYISQTKGKQLLHFYINLGVTTFKLFASIFFIDLAITIGFLLIIKEFI